MIVLHCNARKTGITHDVQPILGYQVKNRANHRGYVAESSNVVFDAYGMLLAGPRRIILGGALAQVGQLCRIIDNAQLTWHRDSGGAVRRV